MPFNDVILTFLYSPPVSLVSRAPKVIVGGGDTLQSSMVQQRGGRAVHCGAIRRLSRWGSTAALTNFPSPYCCHFAMIVKNVRLAAVL